MEHELITEHQANLFMLIVLVAAPLIGLVWGVLLKRPWRGLTVGSLVGVGNYLLWTVYNVVTDRLGLDTVKNLLVNLALFVVVGVIVGVGAAWYGGKSQRGKT